MECNKNQYGNIKGFILFPNYNKIMCKSIRLKLRAIYFEKIGFTKLEAIKAAEKMEN